LIFFTMAIVFLGFSATLERNSLEPDNLGGFPAIYTRAHRARDGIWSLRSGYIFERRVAFMYDGEWIRELPVNLHWNARPLFNGCHAALRAALVNSER
jgi:hypothetical protein